MSDKRSGVRVDLRLTPESNSFIDRMVSSGTYKSRSDVMRKALEELMAKYTGIPTLSSLDDQVKRLRFRIDGYDEDFRVIRRMLEEMKKGV